MKTFFPVVTTLAALWLGMIGIDGSSIAEPPLFGVLAGDPSHAAELVSHGIRVVVMGVSWSEFEPQPGRVNAEYVERLREMIRRFRQAGSLVCLDLGIQYTPGWVFDLPDSRYVNQFGAAYDDPNSGMAMANGIFNQRVRDVQQRYVNQVFEQLGTDFHAVRLGWCQYGELCFPRPRFGGQLNCFWAFDAVAQGKVKGIAQGLKPCPVPGWLPGRSSADHADARAFAEWYCDALVNYQNWQIGVVRRYFAGSLVVLYPSWGLRPGVMEDVIGKDLATDSQEIQRGLDYPRLVAALNDPKAIVCSTWMDGDNPFVHDDQPDPRDWSPIHYLSHLAHQHDPQLIVWGENTEHPADVTAMRLCFDRMARLDVRGLMWAFEKTLYDDSGKHATLQQYADFIRRQ